MEEQSTWHRIVLKISEETSFHGVRQISEPQKFVIRRILWSLLVLGSGAVLVLQFFLNIQGFARWPVSVDIKINYNDSVLFPAITICNFNSFRATAAFEKGYYDLLSNLYSGDNGLTSGISNDSNSLTLDLLNRETGHRLEDLVVKCTWEGSPCNTTDFKVSLTEFGQCYTFNSGEDYDNLYKAVITGSSGGLSLQLNVEQYQYMNGPNEGAGLKVLVHQNNVDGQMKDQGLAIPPGSHAYIAAKIVEIHNMEPKHGVCSDSVKLEFHHIYTIENCYSECKQKYLVDKCGCREFHMPHNNGKPEVCTLKQHLTCGRQAIDEFSFDKTDCFCPIPCDSRMYDTISSHASTSNFDIESLLRSELTSVLQEKFVTSREINSRVDRDMQEHYRRLVVGFHTKAQLLHQALVMIDSKLQETENLTYTLQQATVRAANFHVGRGFETLLYNLQYNYIQRWENYKMKSYDILPTAYLDLENNILTTMDVLTRKSNVFEDYTTYNGLSQNATSQIKYRTLVILPLTEMLNAKLDVMELAFNHTQDIIDRIDNPNPNPENTVTKNGRYDHTINTRTILLHGVVPSEKRRIVNRMMHQEKGMREGIAGYVDFIHTYVEKGGRVKRWKLISVSSSYHDAEIWYNNYVYQLEENVVYRPYRMISERRDAFKTSNMTIEGLANGLLRNLRQTRQLFKEVYQSHWRYINRTMDLTQRYLFNFQVRKTDLAQMVTFNLTKEAVSEFVALLKDTRSQITQLQDDLDSLHQAIRLLWVDIKTEPLTFPLYNSMSYDVNAFLSDSYILKDDLLLQMVIWIVGQGDGEEGERELVKRILLGNLTREDLVGIVGRDLFITPLSNIHEQLLQQHKDIGKNLDIIANMTDFGEFLQNAYNQLKEDGASFLKGNVMGSEFYRENFMRLDIYMQELRYEEITQQEAYSLIQLIGDMGGAMGLFVGGSLLSVMEVFDIFIHHCTKSLLKKK